MTKEGISISFNVGVLSIIDDAMRRTKFTNRSLFIEFLIKSTLLNDERYLALLEKNRQRFLSEFKVINDEILELQEKIDSMKKTEKELNTVNNNYMKL